MRLRLFWSLMLTCYRNPNVSQFHRILEGPLATVLSTVIVMSHERRIGLWTKLDASDFVYRLN
jgi:hypothetical protein